MWYVIVIMFIILQLFIALGIISILYKIDRHILLKNNNSELVWTKINDDILEAEEFLNKKEIFHHPYIADVNNQNKYVVAELLAEYAKEHHSRKINRRNNEE